MIVVPDGSYALNPYIRIDNVGQYRLRLGNSVMGYMLRLDNFLKGLDTEKKKAMNTYMANRQQLTYINKELKAGKSYSERIEELMKKLEDIDKALGVN